MTIFQTILPVLLLGQIPPMNNDEFSHLPVDQQVAARRIKSLGGTVWLPALDGTSAASGFNFRGRAFTDNELPLLSPFPNSSIESVAFVECRVSDEALARTLKQFPKAKSVTIFKMPASDAALAPIADLRGLENINLGHTHITSATLKHIGLQTSLRDLSLLETRVDDSGTRHLEGLAELTRLLLGETSISSAALKSVGNLMKLETLALHKTQVDDEGIAKLTALSRLQTLGLDSTKVTNSGMSAVAKLANLKTLSVEHTAVDAEGLKLLQNMPHLEEVRWDGMYDRPGTPRRRFNTLFHLHLPANATKWSKIRRDAMEAGKRDL